MSNNPLVSIITPSLNQAMFLEQTILSVLNQSYTNIQYIIVDGGSSDGSVDIIKKYASRLFWWTSEPDKGQSDAINKGIEHCTGSIVAYLNSDDLLEPDAVSNAVEAFMLNPDASIVYGKCSHIDGDGRILSPPVGAAVEYKNLLRYTMVPYIHQPACFFHIDKIKRRPLFDIHLKFVMDYELILHCMKKEGPVVFIPKPVAKFRFHLQSKTVAQEHAMYEEKMMVQRRLAPEYAYLWLWRYLKHRANRIRLKLKA